MEFELCNRVLLSIEPNKVSFLITYCNYRSVITARDCKESWFCKVRDVRRTGIARFGFKFLQRQRHWHARYQLHTALFRWHFTHSFADIHVAAILYGNLALMIVRYLRSRCERRNTLTDNIVPLDSRSPS